MDVQTAIRTRRDIEAFAPECPPRAVIGRIVEGAVWAPNHRLTEPWRFTVLAGDGRVAMADAVQAWLEAGGTTEGAVRSARNKVLRAPVSIIVAQVGRSDDPVRDLEDYAACMCAVQNMLLEAHAEGLVVHLSTDRTMLDAGAKAHLGLAPEDRIVAYLNLGYARADAEAKPGVRQPPVVRWDWPA